jgi:undecaprenyl-diphosphatase
MLERLGALDVELFTLIHRTLWPTPWIHVLSIAQNAGTGWGLVPLFLGLFVLAPRERRGEVFLRVLAAVLLASLACELLKRAFPVDRPLTLLPGVVLNHDLPKHFSWPSGHTTAIFSFATSLLLLRLSGRLPARPGNAMTVVAFVFAGLTGLARVAMGAHFPLDVLSGVVLAVSIAYIADGLAEDLLPRLVPQRDIPLKVQIDGNRQAP